jgi:hypothetical protein
MVLSIVQHAESRQKNILKKPCITLLYTMPKRHASTWYKTSRAKCKKIALVRLLIVRRHLMRPSRRQHIPSIQPATRSAPCTLSSGQSTRCWDSRFLQRKSARDRGGHAVTIAARVGVSERRLEVTMRGGLTAH